MAEVELGNILNKRLCFGEEQENQEGATRRKLEEDWISAARAWFVLERRLNGQTSTTRIDTVQTRQSRIERLGENRYNVKKNPKN